MKHRKQQGVAAIELAFVLLPMLILCFGITELGRALYFYNGIEKATRGAARYMSTIDLVNPPVGVTADSIRNNARLIAVCGSITCNPTNPLVTGLTMAMVSVCDPVNCAGTHNNVLTGEGSVDLVTVAVGQVGQDGATFNFTSIFPWVVPDIPFAPIRTTMASQYF